MKEFDFGRVSSFKLKCILLSILAIGFIVVFIPLWQLGVENTFRQEMIANQIQLNQLDSEERALKASSAIYLADEEQTEAYSKANSVI